MASTRATTPLATPATTTPVATPATTTAAVLLFLALGLAFRLQRAWAEPFVAPLEAWRALEASRGGAWAPGAADPLWLTVLSALGRLARSADARTLGHVAASIETLLDVAAGGLLFRLLDRLRVRVGVRLLALGLFLFSGFGVARATACVGASLATVVVLAATLVAASWPRASSVRSSSSSPSPSSSSSRRATGLLAILAAVAFLAGRDARTAGLATLVVVGWRERSARRPIAACALAAACVLPWVVTAANATQTFLPDPSDARAAYLDRLVVAWGAPATGSLAWARGVASMREAVGVVLGSLGIGLTGAAAACGLGVATLVLSSARTRRAIAGQIVRTAPLLVAGVAAIGGTTGAPWELATAGVALLVVLSVVADRALRSLRPSSFAAFGLLLVVALVRPAPSWTSPLPQALGLRADGTSIDLDGISDPGALDALRRGDLFARARARGAVRLVLDPAMRSDAFLGAGARASLVGEGGSRFRIVDAPAKDARIALGEDGVELATARGRELLGDGWIDEEAPDGPSSVGGASEIVFALVADAPVGMSLGVELEATDVAPESAMEVAIDVSLDGAPATHVVAGKGWHEASIPLGAQGAGRHRLRFVPLVTMAVRAPESDWWRTIDGDAARAFRVRRVRLVGPPHHLPPVGPRIGDLGGGRVLSSGWLDVEGTGMDAAVWASSPRAEVVFTTDAADPAHTLVLVAGPPPPDARGADQEVTLTLDGRAMGKATLPAGVVDRHAFELPPGALLAGEHHLALGFARVFDDAEARVRRAAYVRSIALE